MAKKTIEQVEVASKRVLMRVDFNVPLDDAGYITDDRRIRMALPSITSVIERGGRLVLVSHLGRPKGEEYEPAFSLKPAADRLAELLPGVKVSFVGEDCVGQAASEAVSALGDGEVVVLENLRFHKAEKKGEAEFAARLAAFGDIYCNNAFGTAHRNDASMLAVPQAMAGKPRVAGHLLETELKYLFEAIEQARKPFMAVLGGAKVSDKLGAIRNLTGKVDAILVGGAMAYTFLKAKGVEVGSSLVQEDMLQEAEAMARDAEGGPTQLLLPVDHACGREVSSTTPFAEYVGAIADGWMGLDIGTRTAAAYANLIATAQTIVWNGPMGVFETPPFDVGTRVVAEAIVEATGHGAVSIIGGGDSAAAIEAFGLNERVSHVSTGGGASLEMLEGGHFDSVAVLDER
ncbi:MAG: phosphoglycerate kinase [Phycisphaerales bacterium]|nr:MAG: phosphoglycerate kinase [Phycisphaerales bacterium]